MRVKSNGMVQLCCLNCSTRNIVLGERRVGVMDSLYSSILVGDNIIVITNNILDYLSH